MHKQCFMNEFELLQSITFLKVCVFDDRTLTNVYPVCYFFSLGHWNHALHCKLKLAVHYLSSEAWVYMVGWAGSFLSKIQSDWIFTSHCRELSFILNFLCIFSSFPCKLFLFTYILCFMSSWTLLMR